MDVLEQWYRFIFPSIGKIILFAILTAIFILGIFNSCPTGFSCYGNENKGVPLVWHQEYRVMQLEGGAPAFTEVNNYLTLATDIIFWYLIACIPVFLYRKYTRR
ncbi:MAG: hypothetical protein V1708_05635 [Candidatus Micrarchaeota archaeon]